MILELRPGITSAYINLVSYRLISLYHAAPDLCHQLASCQLLKDVRPNHQTAMCHQVKIIFGRGQCAVEDCTDDNSTPTVIWCQKAYLRA